MQALQMDSPKKPTYVIPVAPGDLDAADIRITRDLRVSNALLDDWAALNARYEEEGYLLFRGVLDLASVRRALKRMMAVAVTKGIIKPDTEEPEWTGLDVALRLEESPEFSGVCTELIRDPKNIPIFEKVLGEPFCQVPIVQYRAYPPHYPLSLAHQEGFQSPGVVGYRPVWMPLVDIDESMGGLALALGGIHKRGYVHNMNRPPLFPIAANAIPEDAWATTTFHPGDLLVIHHQTPHVGLYNRSSRIRFSIDTRVQSAKSPSVVLGNVVKADTRSLTLQLQDGPVTTYPLAAEGFLRTSENPGAKLSREEFASVTVPGLRVLAAIRDGEAVMVRRASEG